MQRQPTVRERPGQDRRRFALDLGPSPIVPRVALAEHHATEGGVGRVLQREDGSDMTTDSQRSILRRVALYAGLPAYGMHALRHCFGSRMSSAGARPA